MPKGSKKPYNATKKKASSVSSKMKSFGAKPASKKRANSNARKKR